MGRGVDQVLGRVLVRVRVVLGALVAAVVLSSCSGGAVLSPHAPGATGQPSAPAGRPAASSTGASTAPPAIAVTPVDGATAVPSTQRVRVRVTSGTVADVTVTTAGGREVPGRLADGTWSSDADHLLAPATVYTITTVARGADGTVITGTSTFTTFTPAVTATYMLPYGGDMTYGTGITAAVQFDTPVTDPRFRREVEKRVRVTTVPAQSGSWGWLDNRQLMWRPRVPFTPGTTVTLDAPLAGVQTGAGKFVGTDRSTTFTIGRDRQAHVDIARHRLTISQDGRVLRTIPVSSGRPGPETETRSGTKVIIEKAPEITMDSSTVGIDKGEPGYYKVDTKWNLRVTWTGEFLHSAPWSVDAQGTANVSHGCVNMAPEQAKWVFDTSLIGDIVRFTGSNRQMAPTDGLGVWEYSWAQWQQQSALG